MSAHKHAMHLLSKYGISISPKVSESLRNRYTRQSDAASGAGAGVLGSRSGAASTPTAPPSVPRDLTLEPSAQEREEMDYEAAYSSQLDVWSVASLDQRLRSVQLQPRATAQLRPLPQLLCVRRSLRCRSCDHNLCKPECNPSSIKFKILLAAYYHVPEVRILAWLPDHVLLTIRNPTPYEMRLAIRDLLPQAITLPPKDDTLSDLELTLASERTGAASGVAASAAATAAAAAFQKYPATVIGMQGHKLTIRVPISEHQPPTAAAAADAGADAGAASEGGDSELPRSEGREWKARQVLLTLEHDFVKALVHVAGSEKREPQIESVVQRIRVTEPAPTAAAASGTR